MFSRRQVLIGGATVAGATALGGCPGPTKKLELRWLGWEHYDVRELREEFEETHNCVVRAQYFDGNSEAFAKLRNGGAQDFHLVMADGFWPRLYHRQGLTKTVDPSRVENLSGVFSDFLAPNYELLESDEVPGETVAFPNCWGGYGLTINNSRVEAAGVANIDSLELLFDERLSGHLSTSARFEENIALAGILASHQLGTRIGTKRTDGTPFNPYKLNNEELERAEELLKTQQRLLRTRWNDEDSLERMLRSEQVWVSPEWSGIYRRLHFERLDGDSELNMTHLLKPREGGLGWVDTWCLTDGGDQNDEIRDLAYKWIDFRLSKQSMTTIATDVGWAPCVDIRDELLRRPQGDGERYIETLFLNRTADIKGLYQFDQPSDTARWEELWSRVLAS